jgi:HEAT repeat protein
MPAGRGVLLAALGGIAFAATLWFSAVAMRNAHQATAGVALVAPEVAPAADRPALQPQDQLLDSQELADRTWAIGALAAVPSDESVQALAHILVSSVDYRERLAAVTALQRIAFNDALAAAARQALTGAVTDSNGEVAARARAALGGG